MRAISEKRRLKELGRLLGVNLIIDKSMANRLIIRPPKMEEAEKVIADIKPYF